MQKVNVVRRNCMQIAKWLLQCDYEDFEPMGKNVAQWYDDLYEIYVQLQEELFYSPKLPIMRTFCMILLVRLLCRSLTRNAKNELKEFLQEI